MHAMQRLGQENHGCTCGSERKRPSQICRALNRSGPDADRQYGQGGGEQSSSQAPKQRGEEHGRKEDEECQAAFHPAQERRGHDRSRANGASTSQKLKGDGTFRPKQPVQPKLRHERHGEALHLSARARRKERESCVV